MNDLSGKATKELISAATKKITSDMNVLNQRKNGALSAFRTAADRLGIINDRLNDKVADLTMLEGFIQEQKGSATQMISDNEAVRAKILEIIGK